jgi:hypothetical protein
VSAESLSNPLNIQWRAVTRAAWFLVLGAGIALQFLDYPAAIAQVATPCSSTACANGQLTLVQAQELARLGLSIDFYVAYMTILNLAFPIVFLTVGALLFWRKPDDRMAFMASFTLVAFGLGSTAVTSTAPLVQVLTMLYLAIGNVCLMLFVFLFPDGRFVPQWMRWVAIPGILIQVLTAFFPDNAIINGLAVVGIPIGLLVQIYRYRRVSTPVQRQQTKWVIFGLVVALSGFGVLSTLFGSNPQQSTADPLNYLIINTGMTLSFMAIPFSIGMAILRSRLWDIDILIRRTLVYGALTALLALVYFGTVLVLQEILRAVTGQTSDLAIIASTLAIAALFNPLRRRVQDVIDHRFYRRKYDAQQVLARFAQTARDEVVLEKLSDELLSVVNDTMQPASVSMWLNKPEREVKR